MAKAKTEVAVQEKTAVATLSAEQTALVAQMAEDVGSGFEDASSDAYAIPFVFILQSGSPQCKKSDGAYIEEAEEGHFLNSVSLQVFDGPEVGIDVVPVVFQQRFIAWGLREKGGGYKGEYLPTDPIVQRTHKDPDPTKNRDIMDDFPDQQLVDTRIHYCLMNVDGSWQPVLITFSSTQVKKSRQWMSRMQNIQMKNAAGKVGPAPMASRIWHLTTVPEKNDQGSWYGYKIGDATEHLDPSLYQQAMEFRKAIQSGAAKAQHVDQNSVGGAPAGGAAPEFEEPDAF